MMILYHGEPNLQSLKALVALEEAGLAFESRPMAAVPVERAVPGYAPGVDQRINLEFEGPLLVQGEDRIVSSFFMLEYIADQAPDAGLMPDTPLGRYRVRSVGQIVAGMIAPFVHRLGFAAHPLPDAPEGLDAIEPVERRQAWNTACHGEPESVSAWTEKLRPTIGRLEAMLADGDWFAGDYSIADIDVFAMVRNLPDLAPTLVNPDATPRLCAFLDRMAARPSVAAALARARVADPANCYLPGPEPSRWG